MEKNKVVMILETLTEKIKEVIRLEPEGGETKGDEVFPQEEFVKLEGIKPEENRNTNSSEEEVENEKDYQAVIFDPKSYSDCKKIAEYIKKGKMITINLEYLEPESAQRMMDFIVGATLITRATLREVTKKVYVIVPENANVHYVGKAKKETIYSVVE